MSEIHSFKFHKDNFEDIKKYRFGKNWPVVYVAHNQNEVYIGETINAFYRSKQHYENPIRRALSTIHVIGDEEFNKSATLDIESWLIQYMSADQKFVLQNGNAGLQNHNYYDRQKYKTKFEEIWEKLREMGLARSTLRDLKNTDLFKYSPYKTLTEDQFVVARQVYKDIRSNKSKTYIVHGKPGTGKTILATYLFKYLKEQEETKNLTIGLVVPMASLRKTIAKVFSKIKGLKSGMVIGPNDVVKKEYDLLIVDESHRLQRRKGIMGYGAFDTVSKGLGLGSEGTQLDWIMKSSKYQIFFYDENQSIKPADIRPEDFKKLSAKEYKLVSQMRVEAGDEYINFIEDFFDLKTPQQTNFSNYDFKIFDSAEEMVKEIKEKDKKHKLARVVAGYAWPWYTARGTRAYDIEIGNLKLIWNSTAQDWVNSPNAINEVGCIHTVQGYDLNYVGVIIGSEFSYDTESKKFKVDKKKYFDINGRNGITDPNELERYIINIYKTLLTRGIKGTYVYVVEEHLRSYLNQIVNKKSISIQKEITPKIVKSPYVGEIVKLPLFDSAGCGELMFADSTVQEMIGVPTEYVSKGSKYFVLRTTGDSMDKAGIHDGDLVLCRKNYHPEIGNKVVALIGDDATIKEYQRENGVVVLKPCSTNPKHQPMKFANNEEMSVQAIVVRVLGPEDF